MIGVMASQTKSSCMSFVFRQEGGFQKLYSDSGNWTGGRVGVGRLLGTKFGIAASANPGVDIPNLTIAQASTIYDAKYWTPIGGDALAPGFDLALLDLAVNSGVGKAQGWKAKSAYLGGSNAAQINRICDWRLSFLHRLASWRRFGKGWGRRVEEARKEALTLSTAHLEVS